MANREKARLAQMGYAGLAKPLLFQLDPERAHDISMWVAGTASKRSMTRRLAAAAMGAGTASGQSGIDLWGLHFPNRLGLAAGMDKDGAAVPAWSAIGFGHVEVGTVTAISQPGNDKPRLTRLPKNRALINAMGFNNNGAQALAAALRRERRRGLVDIPVGVSIGKSKVTPIGAATQDYLASLRAVRDVADYVAINVSSPNTPNLRSLQDATPLRELLTSIVAAAAGQPVLLKLAPDLSDPAIDEALQVATDSGIAGIIASNTTLRRDGLIGPESEIAPVTGGLSGAPLRSRSLAMVQRITRTTDFPVIGVGGIMTVDDGQAMIDAGASLVQIYTGLIYGGPRLVRGLRSL
ncbi:MAG: quinone-dependent dihydroorotate dehydrogenase [Ornithinimicrobium sp.]